MAAALHTHKITVAEEVASQLKIAETLDTATLLRELSNRGQMLANAEPFSDHYIAVGEVIAGVEKIILARFAAAHRL